MIFILPSKIHYIDGAFSAPSGLATVIFGKNAQYFSIFSEKIAQNKEKILLSIFRGKDLAKTH